MSDEQKKVFDIIEDWIGDELAAMDIAEEIVTALEGESNEAAKPAMKYYVEFYDLGGFSEYKKETAHKNYKEGDLIKYNNIVWKVKHTITCEDEGRANVIFGAYQSRRQD